MKKKIRGLLISDNLTFANKLVQPLAAVGIRLVEQPRFAQSLDPKQLRGKVDVLIFNFDFNLPYYMDAIKTMHPHIPSIPFFSVSENTTESRMVEIIRMGYVGVFTAQQLERMYEVAARTLEWGRFTDRELSYGSTDFEDIFNQLPDPVFLEDFSILKQRIIEMRKQGITDFDTYFSNNLDEVEKLAKSTVIVAANQAALDYVNVSSMHDIFQLDHIIRAEGTLREFSTEFIKLANGETDFSLSGPDFRGGFHIVEVKVVKGHEQDLRRVMVLIKNVTALVESQKEAQTKENMLRGLVERTPSIFYTVLTAQDGKFLFISPQIEQLTGYSQQEWLEGPNMWRQVMPPDDFAYVSSITTENTPANTPVKIDYRIISRDGQLKWVRDTFQVVNNAEGKPEFWQGALYDVTNEKLAELALKESEQKMTRIMANLPGLVYRTHLDKEDRIDFLSDGCLALTGYTPEELKGINRHDVLQLLGIQQLLTTDRPWAENLHPDGGFELVYTITTKQGHVKWLMDRGIVVQNSEGNGETIEGIMLDITEQKLAEEQVRRFTEELEDLYQSSAFISSLLDPQKAAQQVVKVIGSRQGWDVINIDLHDEAKNNLVNVAFKAPSGNSGYKAKLDKYQQKGLTGATMRALKERKAIRSGDVRTVPGYLSLDPGIKSCLYVPMVATNAAVGTIAVESMTPNAFSESDEKLLTVLANQVAVAIINARLFVTANQEINARKRVEKQLLAEQQQLEQTVADRTEALRNANTELEKSAKMKSEFMAAISHELRTPLTGIMGLSEVMGMQALGTLNAKQIASIKLITENGRRLLNMINDILDYTRLEANQVSLSLGTVSINYLARNLVGTLTPEAAAKQIELNLNLPENEVMLECDSKKVKQMLTNLLSNAIKFTPAHGNISVDVLDDVANSQVLLSVTDNGIGINESDAENLFKPFIQLDSRLERNYNGAGLGLVLVNKLVELHKGTITVKSEPEHGSCFTICLPKSQN